MRILVLLGCYALLVAPEVQADEEPLEFNSGEKRVALIELFTSEGCSSCPPADRWLSNLKREPNLFTQFVPVAFHVDYWDYIGWRDEFARPEFSARQRRYIDQGGARVVYTPGLFKNGQEWRSRQIAAVGADSAETAGSLSLAIVDNTFHGRFAAAEADQSQLQLNIALLGMNLETRVRAGENRGKTLHHDFVVVGFSSVALVYENGIYNAAGQLPDKPGNADELAVAAWVSRNLLLAPIQSVGGFLER